MKNLRSKLLFLFLAVIFLIILAELFARRCGCEFAVMRFGRFLPGVLQMRCVVGMGEVLPRLLLGDALGLVIALDAGGRLGRAGGRGFLDRGSDRREVTPHAENPWPMAPVRGNGELT